MLSSLGLASGAVSFSPPRQAWIRPKHSARLFFNRASSGDALVVDSNAVASSATQILPTEMITPKRKQRQRQAKVDTPSSTPVAEPDLDTSSASMQTSAGHAQAKSIAVAAPKALPSFSKDARPKSQHLIKISADQNIGSASAFLKRVRGTLPSRGGSWCLHMSLELLKLPQSLISEEKAMMVATGQDAIWQAIRVLRCSRSMLIQVRIVSKIMESSLAQNLRLGPDAFFFNPSTL